MPFQRSAFCVLRSAFDLCKRYAPPLRLFSRHTGGHMKRIIAAVAIAALSTSLAYASQADAAANRRDVRRAQQQLRMAKLSQRLGLTIEQKQQIKSINRSFRENNREFLQSFRANRTAMRQARRANDGKRIDELEPVVKEQRAHMRELRAARRARISEVLTPEQRS